MSFNYNETQLSIIDSVQNIMKNFDDDYWLECDQKSIFPHKFYDEIADGGWLGICMPKEFGGSALGITEASIFMQKVSETGGGMAAASSIHINIFGPHPIVVHGNNEQKNKWLPSLINGKEKTCFGVTEPDSGLDTGKLKTFAKKINNGYLINGQKIWTSTAQIADKILLLARTTPIEECKKNTDGLSLFYTKLDRKKIEVTEIPKMGRSAVDSNQIFIDNLEVEDFDRIGEEGKGFIYQMIQFQEERLYAAAAALKGYENIIQETIEYTRQREAFGKAILDNQVVHYRLAELQTEVELLRALTYNAVEEYIEGKDVLTKASMVKLKTGRLGREISDACLQYWGGMGFMWESSVARAYRDTRLGSIGGGSDEVMLGIISKQMGILD